MSTVKTGTKPAGTKPAAKAAEEVVITFKYTKETPKAVVFTADDLEASSIYFKKAELADLGLEGATGFTATITPIK